MKLAAAARFIGITLITGCAFVPMAAAQGAAVSMNIDVSSRSAALGGASDALFWGEERNHWANPALLGYEHGIRYEHGYTQLLPGLANFPFTSDVIKFGGGGVGLVLSGQPFGYGGVNLDYGSRPQFDSGEVG